jgi:predicted lysophospholipase L1 biosynthesis ABC-type transport system permease subunit
MTARRGARGENAWRQIERDQQIDKQLRKVSVIAWTSTIVLALVFAVLTGLQVAQFLTPVLKGQLPASVLAGAAFPLLIVPGLLSTLIATLATVGIFLRLRTASLQEIQLRLAAREEMLTRNDAEDRK